ncbi:carcinoembryonic antigen-related cell adhesion molecule 1-like [Suncus etruscus]|uniref:carcinoembryonic antigen-related cell adhesion molecule 1-like n=1 Tax=Suncus etruscus TaxID=109475 RepID=UPI00210FCB55|nr:carcinoembryonic antigen-related cell adhesion molecule 1-like [Suncus etruscus]
MESPSVPAHRGALPWQGLLITVSLLSFWNLPITAQITVKSVPPDVAEGNPVLLLVHNIPPKPAKYNWYRNDINESMSIIKFIVNPENTTHGPLYSNRETIYSNGSLLIQNLTKEDSGKYVIQVITENFESPTGNGQVHVHALLPQPNITVNNSSPVEQKDSVVLMCEPESSGTTYRWFNNTQPIQPSTRLQLSPDNRILTVLNVTRNDRGPYVCETSNPVSVQRSNPFYLTVLYGPDDPTISPSKRDYLQGENLSLSCLTASYPPAEFSWFVGEKPLGFTQTLSIHNLSLNDSGSYSCLVNNSATHLNRTTVINITVSKSVTLPSIRASNTTVTEGAGPVVLTCLTNDTGISIRWYLNDKDLQPAERRKLSADNRTLTLQPVWEADGGDYQCEVSNPVSSRRSNQVRLKVTSTSGLSAGAIAGIVIGVLAGVALIAALVYFLYVRKTGGANDQRHLTENKLSASNHSKYSIHPMTLSQCFL